MSWLFSRALVAAFSAANCSDGEPSAQLNVMPTQRPFWRNDKTMDISTRSPFGLTSKLLTVDRGEALLTWFREVSLARTSVAPGKVQESPESEADCGRKWPAWFAKWDRGSSSWKTRQCSLLGDSESFSATWPRWGSMRDGQCSERTMPERLTREIGSGLWPTASARDWKDTPGMAQEAFDKSWKFRNRFPTTKATDADRGGRGDLIQAVRGNSNKRFKFWPTPNVPNGGRRVPEGAEIKGGESPTAYVDGKKCQVGLEQAVKWWPTPRTPSKSGGGTDLDCGAGARSMMDEKTRKELTGGSLNPDWVEWLMGWPIGWTDLKPLETGKFRQWLDSHGKF